jgi:hypothetical protein
MVIWQNNCVLNQAMYKAPHIVTSLQMLLAEWKSVQQVQHNVGVSTSNVDKQSIMIGTNLTCNVDASFFQDCNHTGLGMHHRCRW